MSENENIFIEDDKTVVSETPEVEDVPQHPSIKYNEVELPSKGVLGYPESIYYRDVLVKDEKILSSATPANYSKVLNKVLKSLMKDQSFYEKISIHDRDFLLMWIWANSYSTKKKVESTCKHCGNFDPQEIDLTDIDVDDLSDDYTNPFPMKTVNGIEYTLKLLTIEDENKATSFCKNRKDVDQVTMLMYMSIGLKKVMTMDQKIKYIDDSFAGKDMAMIRAFHAHFKYGLKSEIEFTCSECQEVTLTEIPFQDDFFMPSLQDDFAEIVQFNKRNRD